MLPKRGKCVFGCVCSLIEKCHFRRLGVWLIVEVSCCSFFTDQLCLRFSNRPHSWRTFSSSSVALFRRFSVLLWFFYFPNFSTKLILLLFITFLSRQYVLNFAECRIQGVSRRFDASEPFFGVLSLARSGKPQRCLRVLPIAFSFSFQSIYLFLVDFAFFHSFLCRSSFVVTTM